MTADVAATIAANQREADRVALVAALHLPPETTWEEALARVVPVPAEVPAKGCRGCGNDIGGKYCDALFTGRPNRDTVRVWSDTHLEDDQMTPKPGAPECPGRVER